MTLFFRAFFERPDTQPVRNICNRPSLTPCAASFSSPRLQGLVGRFPTLAARHEKPPFYARAGRELPALLPQQDRAL